MKPHVVKLLTLLDDESSTQEEIKKFASKLFASEYTDDMMTKLCLHKNTPLQIKKECLCTTLWLSASDSIPILQAFLNSEPDLTCQDWQSVWMVSGAALFPVKKCVETITYCIETYPDKITRGFLEFLLGEGVLKNLKYIPEPVIAKFYYSIFCHPMTDDDFKKAMIDIASHLSPASMWDICPIPNEDGLKVKLYSITGETRFLPKEASELFWF